MDALTVARNVSVSIMFGVICYAIGIYASLTAAFAFVAAILCFLVHDFRDGLEEILGNTERMRTTQLLTIYSDGNEPEGDTD